MRFTTRLSGPSTRVNRRTTTPDNTIVVPTAKLAERVEKTGDIFCWNDQRLVGELHGPPSDWEHLRQGVGSGPGTPITMVTYHVNNAADDFVLYIGFQDRPDGVAMFWDEAVVLIPPAR